MLHQNTAWRTRQGQKLHSDGCGIVHADALVLQILIVMTVEFWCYETRGLIMTGGPIMTLADVIWWMPHCTQ